MFVCLQVALRSDTRSDILDWPVLFESRIQPVTCPITFCAQLEATLTGTPSSIPELLADRDRVVLALRRAITGMLPCKDAGRTALKAKFADVTDSGIFSKVGFGCGFAFRAQKRWKVRACVWAIERDLRTCASPDAHPFLGGGVTERAPHYHEALLMLALCLFGVIPPPVR